VVKQSLGATIGKLAIQFEDILSVAATAGIGCYAILQVIVSLGFEATSGLSIYAALTGNFGCKPGVWVCDLVLSSTMTLGGLGCMNQMYMTRVMKLLVHDPNYCGKNPYERVLVKITSTFAVVFTMNDVMHAEGDSGTASRKDRRNLKQKKDMVTMQIMTVVNDVAGIILSSSMFVSIAEGFQLGCFPLNDSLLMYFALLLGAIGAYSMALQKFLITTHSMAAERRNARDRRLKLHLILSAFMMPFVLACTVLSMMLLPETPFEIPQFQQVFDVAGIESPLGNMTIQDKVKSHSNDALKEHLPVSVTAACCLQRVVYSGLLFTAGRDFPRGAAHK
jgi:hypothetical protein